MKRFTFNALRYVSIFHMLIKIKQFFCHFLQLSTHGCLCALPKKLPLIFEWIEMMKILSSAKIFIQSNIEVLFYYNDHSSIPCTPWLTLQIFVDPGKVLIDLNLFLF